MAGQPVGEFDVSDIAVTWEKVTTHGNNLAIIDVNEAFEITVTFYGKGTEWMNLQGVPLKYGVEIFAEGIGLPPSDKNLGKTEGNLVPGQTDPYKVVCKVPNGINQEGIYRLAAMVTFEKWYGWLGFLEGPMIQIHPKEEYP